MKLTLTRKEASDIILKHFGVPDGSPIEIEIIDTYSSLVQLFRETLSPYCDKVGQLNPAEKIPALKILRRTFGLSINQAKSAVENIDETINFLAINGRFPDLSEISPVT
jgi:ribosomal protein L7/L12